MAGQHTGGMGLKDWRKRRSMRDPVRGEFQVTDKYSARPGGSSAREMLTGVVTGPGVPATPGEHLDDGTGRWAGHQVLPAMVDRGDPMNFVILWDEVPRPGPQAGARRTAADAAAQQQADVAAPGQAPAPEPDSAPAADATPVAGSAPSPDWVRGVLADVLPSLLASGGPSIILEEGAQVIDLTRGPTPATGTEDGEPATFGDQHPESD